MRAKKLTFLLGTLLTFGTGIRDAHASHCSDEIFDSLGKAFLFTAGTAGSAAFVVSDTRDVSYPLAAGASLLTGVLALPLATLVDVGDGCGDGFWLNWGPSITGMVGAIVGAAVTYGLAGPRSETKRQSRQQNLRFDLAATPGGAMGMLVGNY